LINDEKLEELILLSQDKNGRITDGPENIPDFFTLILE
jgi:prenyltransferase beta subunit